jgi:hypothetical protein
MPVVGIIHHRGRKTGRPYATPLGIRPVLRTGDRAEIARVRGEPGNPPLGLADVLDQMVIFMLPRSYWLTSPPRTAGAENCVTCRARVSGTHTAHPQPCSQGPGDMNCQSPRSVKNVAGSIASTST